MALTEFQLIDRFVGRFARPGRGVLLGPGDDAALLRPSPGKALVATVDCVRDGVHFGAHFRAEEIGHKALAVNLSDLAAMGATPRWFLVALELPAEFFNSKVDGIATGMANLARKNGCLLAGGNVIRSERLGLTVTALGEVSPKLALRRDGLRPGQAVAVTGALGGAAYGLRQLAAGTRTFADAQLAPQPRVAAGRAALGLATAAIDVSDGLAQDLGHLANRSGCGIEISAGDLPISTDARRSRDFLELALNGGEDYELVFGIDGAKLPALSRKLERLGVPLTPIGRAVREPGLWAVGEDGSREPLAPRGFQHG